MTFNVDMMGGVVEYLDDDAQVVYRGHYDLELREPHHRFVCVYPLWAARGAVRHLRFYGLDPDHDRIDVTMRSPVCRGDTVVVTVHPEGQPEGGKHDPA